MRQALLGVGMITRETGQTTYQLDKGKSKLIEDLNDENNLLIQFMQLEKRQHLQPTLKLVYPHNS